MQFLGIPCCCWCSTPGFWSFLFCSSVGRCTYTRILYCFASVYVASMYLPVYLQHSLLRSCARCPQVRQKDRSLATERRQAEKLLCCVPITRNSLRIILVLFGSSASLRPLQALFFGLLFFCEGGGYSVPQFTVRCRAAALQRLFKLRQCRASD